MRPELGEDMKGASHVRVRWGKDLTVEEIEGEVSNGAASASVHGIVGLLQLFHGEHRNSIYL